MNISLSDTKELDISANTLAVNLGLSYPSIQGIITGKLKITADIDLRLCRYFRLSDGYFLRLQNAYEIIEAKRS